MSEPAPSPEARLPRAVVVLLGLAAAFIVIGGLKEAKDLVGPTFLALVLTIAAHPMRRWLDRYVPTWVASTVCILVVYVILVGLAVAVVLSVARFASLLPNYKDQFNNWVNGVAEHMKQFGVDSDKVHSVASSLDLGKLTDALSSILSGALGTVSNLVFILTLVLFMTLDASQFPRLLQLAQRNKPDLVDAIGSFVHSTRTYLIVSTVFGLIVAVLDTIALAIMGVPAPLVWGLLAFLTNYIPNIGFVIGLIPPAVLALLEGGPGLMLAVIAVYCILNVIIQSVIQPKVVGDSVGLSTTLSFMSLVFWAWVIGALGAVLAIPLTLLAKALLVEADPGSKWLGPLVSNRDGHEPAPEPAQEPVSPPGS